MKRILQKTVIKFYSYIFAYRSSSRKKLTVFNLDSVQTATRGVNYTEGIASLKKWQGKTILGKKF